MHRIATLVAAGALLASGCTYGLYEKGTVRSIDYRRDAGEGSLQASATREPEGVRVRLLRLNDVKLERTTHFKTIEWESDWVPWVEPLELVTAPLYLPIMLLVVAAGVAPPEADHVRVPASGKLMVATAPINPLVSIFGTDVRREEISEEEVFSEEAEPLSYQMRLPVQSYPLSYEILDESGAPLVQGDARTDLYGELLLRGDMAARARKLKLQGEGVEQVLELR